MTNSHRTLIRSHVKWGYWGREQLLENLFAVFYITTTRCIPFKLHADIPWVSLHCRKEVDLDWPWTWDLSRNLDVKKLCICTIVPVYCLITNNYGKDITRGKRCTFYMEVAPIGGKNEKIVGLFQIHCILLNVLKVGLLNLASCFTTIWAGVNWEMGDLDIFFKVTEVK